MASAVFMVGVPVLERIFPRCLTIQVIDPAIKEKRHAKIIVLIGGAIVIADQAQPKAQRHKRYHGREQ